MKAETIYTWKKKSENDIQYVHTMRIWYTKANGWNKEGHIMMHCNCGYTMHLKPEGFDYTSDFGQYRIAEIIEDHAFISGLHDINIFNSMNNPVLSESAIELLRECKAFRINIVKSNFDEINPVALPSPQKTED